MNIRSLIDQWDGSWVYCWGEKSSTNGGNTLNFGKVRQSIGLCWGNHTLLINGTIWTLIYCNTSYRWAYHVTSKQLILLVNIWYTFSQTGVWMKPSQFDLTYYYTRHGNMLSFPLSTVPLCFTTSPPSCTNFEVLIHSSQKLILKVEN